MEFNGWVWFQMSALRGVRNSGGEIVSQITQISPFLKETSRIAGGPHLRESANRGSTVHVYSAVRFYMYVFVSLVFVLTVSAIYKPAQHTTTGWRTYKDSTTINYTCCKDLTCGLHT